MKAGLRAFFLATLCLLTSVAVAHEMSMAEMELRQVSPTEFQWQWTASGNRPASEVVKLVWPEGCHAEEDRVRCGSNGMTGKLSVKGVGKAYSAAMVKVFWLDGQ